MRHELVCKKCKRTLSLPVWIYDESMGKRKKNKGWAKIPAPDGSSLPDIVMNGQFGDYRSPAGTVLKRINAETHRDVGNLYYSIRPDSLTNQVKPNDYWKVECCGVYPGKKPNLSCKCGNPIGFEFGDCYTLNYVLPLARTTKWQTVKS